MSDNDFDFLSTVRDAYRRAIQARAKQLSDNDWWDQIGRDKEIGPILARAAAAFDAVKINASASRYNGNLSALFVSRDELTFEHIGNGRVVAVSTLNGRAQLQRHPDTGQLCLTDVVQSVQEFVVAAVSKYCE